MPAVEAVVPAILKAVSSLFVSKAVVAAADPSQAGLLQPVSEKVSLLVWIHRAPGFRSLALVDVALVLHALDRALQSSLPAPALNPALLSFPLSIAWSLLFSTWQLCDHLLPSVCLCLWLLMR